MIALSGITKKFHKGTLYELRALDDIELFIPKAEFLVVVGANGSGKSTLLNVLAGNQRIDKGKIEIDSIDVTHLPDFERSKYVSRIFQNPLSGTAPDLSIIDNFRLAALRTQPKYLRIGIDSGFREKVKNKIAFLEMGLEHKLDFQMGLLSGGQRQALTLIMAVMDETKVLLLDEPTAALDPKSSEIVAKKTQELVEHFQLTALLVTHDIKLAQRCGNRLIQMETGKIIRDLKSEEKIQIKVQHIYDWFA